MHHRRPVQIVEFPRRCLAFAAFTSRIRHRKTAEIATPCDRHLADRECPKTQRSQSAGPFMAGPVCVLGEKPQKRVAGRAQAGLARGGIAPKPLLSAD